MRPLKPTSSTLGSRPRLLRQRRVPKRTAADHELLEGPALTRSRPADRSFAVITLGSASRLSASGRSCSGEHSLHLCLSHGVGCAREADECGEDGRPAAVVERRGRIMHVAEAGESGARAARPAVERHTTSVYKLLKAAAGGAPRSSGVVVEPCTDPASAFSPRSARPPRAYPTFRTVSHGRCASSCASSHSSRPSAPSPAPPSRIMIKNQAKRAQLKSYYC